MEIFINNFNNSKSCLPLESQPADYEYGFCYVQEVLDGMEKPSGIRNTYIFDRRDETAGALPNHFSVHMLGRSDRIDVVFLLCG